MAHAVQTGLPPAVLDVYRASELILLALSGLAIALAGALAPASWAAGTRTASAPNNPNPHHRKAEPASR
jgi:putative ABC transport system permease protein